MDGAPPASSSPPIFLPSAIEAPINPACGFMDVGCFRNVVEILRESLDKNDRCLAQWVEAEYLDGPAGRDAGQAINDRKDFVRLNEAYRRAKFRSGSVLEKWPFYCTDWTKMSLRAATAVAKGPSPSVQGDQAHGSPGLVMVTHESRPEPVKIAQDSIGPRALTQATAQGIVGQENMAHNASRQVSGADGTLDHAYPNNYRGGTPSQTFQSGGLVPTPAPSPAPTVPTLSVVSTMDAPLDDQQHLQIADSAMTTTESNIPVVEDPKSDLALKRRRDTVLRNLAAAREARSKKRQKLNSKSPAPKAPKTGRQKQESLKSNTTPPPDPIVATPAPTEAIQAGHSAYSAGAVLEDQVIEEPDTAINASYPAPAVQSARAPNTPGIEFFARIQTAIRVQEIVLPASAFAGDVGKIKDYVEWKEQEPDTDMKFHQFTRFMAFAKKK
ncbi:hypothetical protein BCR34DRAFT_596621 [Clohesyomyces aquaticus]|uniref:Uncharacterized protein n=1 Tax=Clohesyomyces aquaticus TaxID=1231657 RepID=A0A1Y2A6B3_9PLEO|nr:hypothetical protein BCR34DRAFT_596621 [Clohesyomyces aquaticus]